VASLPKYRVNGGFWHKFGMKMRRTHGRLAQRRLRYLCGKQWIFSEFEVQAGMKNSLHWSGSWDDGCVRFSWQNTESLGTPQVSLVERNPSG
jgi:hypothetical protein